MGAPKEFKDMSKVLGKWAQILEALCEMEKPEADYVLERIRADLVKIDG